MLYKALIGIGLCVLLNNVVQASNILTQPLELKDIFGLSVTEEANAQFCSVRIRGLAGHSAMMIERTVVERVGRSANVLIELSLIKNGGSGNFDLAVNIDSAIDEVIFGKAKIVVWRRENSKCIIKNINK